MKLQSDYSPTLLSLCCETTVRSRFKIEPRFKTFSKRKGLSIETAKLSKQGAVITKTFQEAEILSHFENLISSIPLSACAENEHSYNEQAVSSTNSNGSVFLFMGSDKVAQNMEMLTAHGITHIINCSGNESRNYFPSQFIYKTFHLEDVPSEDISRYFMETVSFIEEAVSCNSNNKVLVHCAKGVSRSAAVVISYLIHKNKWNFEQASLHVKKCRAVCDPNAGFSFSLMEWEKLCNSQETLSVNNNDIPLTTQPAATLCSSQIS